MKIDNLNKLIARMEMLREDQFDMRYVFRTSDGRVSRDDFYSIVVDTNECGTAACIAGECGVVAGAPIGTAWTGEEAYRWLDIGSTAGILLFTPSEYETGSQRYPLRRAIGTLKRLRDTYLATGQVVVDWGPDPGDEPKTPWVAPQVAEVIAPALPAEITSLLRPSAVKTEA